MNEFEFYNKIVIDGESNIKTVTVPKTGNITNCKSKYDFFKRIKLDENNKLKITFE